MTDSEIVSNLGALTDRIDDFSKIANIPMHKQFISIGHPNRSSHKLSALKSINVHYTGNENPGSTDIVNAKYFGRPFDIEKNDFFEKNTKVPFRYGSTAILFDNDSGTLALPLNNTSWAVGDRPLEYTEEFKGQKPLAKYVFKNRQNYESLNIEMCNNDIIKNSDEDWNGSVENAKKFIIWVIKELGLELMVEASLHPETVTKPYDPGQILLLRHHDITGKMCPLRFVKNPKEWETFVHDIKEAL